MFKSLVSLALVSALALPGALAAFSVDTPPQLVQCQPVDIKWSGASAGAIDIIFVDPKNPCDSVLADLGTNNTGTSRTWTVDLKAGTPAQVSLVDSAGDEAWSGVVTVQNSTDSSCLAGSHSSSSSAKPSSSSTPGTTAPTTLVVPAANAAQTAPPTSSSAGAAIPVGAANAGLNPDGSGAAAFTFSAPVIALSSVAAILISAAF